MRPSPWAVMFIEIKEGRQSQKFARFKDLSLSTYTETEREILKLLVGAGAQIGAEIYPYTYRNIVLSIIKMGWNEILSPFIKNVPKNALNDLLVSTLGPHIFPPSKNLGFDNIYKSCDILLSLGAEPDSPGRGSGKMALISAIKGGNLSIVKLLLEHGADPNHRCIIGGEGGALAQMYYRW